jgi:hypothetical protein
MLYSNIGNKKSFHTLAKLHHKTEGAICKFSYSTPTQKTVRDAHRLHRLDHGTHFWVFAIKNM